MIKRKPLPIQDIISFFIGFLFKIPAVKKFAKENPVAGRIIEGLNIAMPVAAIYFMTVYNSEAAFDWKEFIDYMIPTMLTVFGFSFGKYDRVCKESMTIDEPKDIIDDDFDDEYVDEEPVKKVAKKRINR